MLERKRECVREREEKKRASAGKNCWEERTNEKPRRGDRQQENAVMGREGEGVGKEEQDETRQGRAELKRGGKPSLPVLRFIF